MRDLKDHLEPLESMTPTGRWTDIVEREPRRDEADPRRSRVPVFVFAAATLAILVVIAMSLAPLGGRRSSTLAAPGGPLPYWVVQRAYEIAYRWGDITPSAAEWAFTEPTGVLVPAGSQLGDAPQYVVVLHGDFISPPDPSGGGDAIAMGHVLRIALDRDTHAVIRTVLGSGEEGPTPGFEAFDLTPATESMAYEEDGWSAIVPPGWLMYVLPRDFGTAWSSGGVITNTDEFEPAGGHGVPPQASADGFPGDGIALVVSRALGLEPQGVVATLPLSIDSFHVGSSIGSSSISTSWFEHDGRMFVAAIRTGSDVSAADRAAMADVVASLEFDDAVGPPDTIVVPDLTGQTWEGARGTLLDLGFEVDRVDANFDDIPAGTVAAQEPPAEKTAAAGSRVTLTVSLGPAGEVGDLGALPQVGIVVSDVSGSKLLDVDGNVLATLPGFELVGNLGAPGVWFQSGDRFFALDPSAGRLVEVPRGDANDAMYDEGPEPRLSPPPGSVGGSWRYQLLPSVGTASLAQWSGECEAPTAYWIDADGTETILTGEDSISDAPESFALGWTPGGEAVALLPQGTCGGSIRAPGVYEFRRPGVGRLLYATGPDPTARAEMWEVP